MGKIFNKDNDYSFLIYEPDTEASGWDGIDKGDVLTVNNAICLAVKDFEEAIDSKITMITKTKQAYGSKEQGTGTEIKAGEKVYWNATTEIVTPTAGGNKLIGLCIRDAEADDEYVHIDFDGFINNVA